MTIVAIFRSHSKNVLFFVHSNLLCYCPSRSQLCALNTKHSQSWKLQLELCNLGKVTDYKLLCIVLNTFIFNQNKEKSLSNPVSKWKTLNLQNRKSIECCWYLPPDEFTNIGCFLNSLRMADIFPTSKLREKGSASCSSFLSSFSKFLL